MKRSRERVPFALLVDLSLGICHHSVIEATISGPLSARKAGLPHVVDFLIALRADSLMSSDFLPFNPLTQLREIGVLAFVARHAPNRRKSGGRRRETGRNRP